jgi:hypothetical protein
MMYGTIATAAMCGQRVHLIQNQQTSGLLVTRSHNGGLRRQSRTLM